MFKRGARRDPQVAPETNTTSRQETTTVHDLILALFFVSLLVTPAMVAAISGRETSQAAPLKPAKSRSQGKRMAPQQARFSQAETLPLHGTRALAGR